MTYNEYLKELLNNIWYEIDEQGRLKPRLNKLQRYLYF